MILLDMDMPKSCFDCRFRTDTGECELTGLYTSHKAYVMPLSCDCPIKAEIPKDATNGDVIEALFSWIKSEKDYENSMVAILMSGHKGYIHFDLEWWNAPWKGQEE